MSDIAHCGPYYANDYLRVVPAPDGVIVSMPDNDLAVFGQVLELLAGLLKH